MWFYNKTEQHEMQDLYWMYVCNIKDTEKKIERKVSTHILRHKKVLFIKARRKKRPPKQLLL